MQPSEKLHVKDLNVEGFRSNGRVWAFVFGLQSSGCLKLGFHVSYIQRGTNHTHLKTLVHGIIH
jgi:hypothetical protein